MVRKNCKFSQELRGGVWARRGAARRGGWGGRRGGGGGARTSALQVLVLLHQLYPRFNLNHCMFEPCLNPGSTVRVTGMGGVQARGLAGPGRGWLSSRFYSRELPMYFFTSV